MKNSKFLTLNSFDFIKSLLIAVFTSVISVVYTTVSNGSLEIDWKAVATTALTSALAYLMKNLITNEKGEVSTND